MQDDGHARASFAAGKYIDGTLVELQAEEVGDDGGLAGEAGLDDALHHRLHVAGVALALVEPVLQLRAAAGDEGQHGQSHH